LPPILWGVFVALLGEGPNIRKLANALTEDRTEMIRDELCGPSDSGASVGERVLASPRQRLRDSQFVCAVNDGETAEVRALNGELFDAPLDVEQLSLLAPQSDE